MVKQAWRYKALADNTLEVEQFCARYGLRLEVLNRGYQLRIEEVLDVYPVRKRWHWIPTGTRGDWDTVNDLKYILLNNLPGLIGRVDATDNPNIIDVNRTAKEQPNGWWTRLKSKFKRLK